MVEFLRCCGSRAWASEMAASRPFQGEKELLDVAEDVWLRLSPEDWKEAFSHHPRIGDRAKLREKFASTAQWAEREQAGVKDASEETLQLLLEGNREYEERFGHIFIVCATGKGADDMIALLRQRLGNPPGVELEIAAAEQQMITRLRLEKLLTG
ncbi:MAG: 2-oxo-4-hydroxy-4-carboxy-5-ureidoimidazoline decarboxylase [Ignavibacteriae bacterium]|nr:2-oxo-4-hydroxy-4-carboxy-5-ureidoimidazoline decarboxylase [Ignavibacteriota bacterium]